MTNLGENKLAQTGVYETKKKDGTLYYRTSITYKRKHISLGSFADKNLAHQVYLEGRALVENNQTKVTDYSSSMVIPHDKFISLINFRDNGIYFSTPIYLRKQYFEYYLSKTQVLKFDRDDLFFYASHKIQQKGGYLFVSDYGSQYKILGRYGIRPFAVYGRDYVMVNGDKNDYRYSNIKILNFYTGVVHQTDGNTDCYMTRIHINGNYIVGYYPDEVTAAIAYNKAVDILHYNGFSKNYTKNYIISLSADDYHNIYNKLSISVKIQNLKP